VGLTEPRLLWEDGCVESRPSKQAEKEKEFRDMAEFIWTRTVTREETGTLDIDAEDIVSQLGGYGDLTLANNDTITIEYQFSAEEIYDSFNQDISWEVDDSGDSDETNVAFKEVVG
jgi:hypothetical protein|tara:strand:+ start:339 stop:686 length:348 start_codon:yes stop_codon:yes gene_type:complete